MVREVGCAIPEGKLQMRIQRILILFALSMFVAACLRSERVDTLYAQRCLGCHGPSGKGDGPVAASLPNPVPDFRATVQHRSVSQIRKIITQGQGIMPAYGPALSGGEIQDMVRMVRVVSQEGRTLQWWERFEPLVWAHCSVPWEFVLGYDQPPEEATP